MKKMKKHKDKHKGPIKKYGKHGMMGPQRSAPGGGHSGGHTQSGGLYGKDFPAIHCY